MLFTNVAIEYEDYRLNHKTPVWNSNPVNPLFFIAYLSMIRFKNLLSSHVRLFYPIILLSFEISTELLLHYPFCHSNSVLPTSVLLLTAQMLL